jgi:hypothetical protein
MQETGMILRTRHLIIGGIAVVIGLAAVGAADNNMFSDDAPELVLNVAVT